MKPAQLVECLFQEPVQVVDNFIHIKKQEVGKVALAQYQTMKSFDSKWSKASGTSNLDQLNSFQKDWFLTLYGFSEEIELKQFLAQKSVIFDAGCGLGEKAAWLADLASHALVIAMDISETIGIAADRHHDRPNLFFIQGDIADTGINPGSVDFVVCDQVIMHTEEPEQTFAHLAQLLSPKGEFACYVYRKKALPRELIDEYFRSATHHISQKEMWEFAAQVTELGKRLSELNVQFECPDLPLIGIKGGQYDLQRFIYWNFLKCFWREDWGTELCAITNFDWYSPSNAKRYSKEEFLELIVQNDLTIKFFHEEEACYSGRFLKND